MILIYFVKYSRLNYGDFDLNIQLYLKFNIKNYRNDLISNI